MMTIMGESAVQVVKVLRDPAASPERMRGVVQELFDAFRDGPQAREALEILSREIPTLGGPGGAFLTIVCGRLVEKGVDPTPMAEPMIAKLRALVPPARRFFDACLGQVSKDSKQPHEDFDVACAQAAPSMAAEARAWAELEGIYPAWIALFAASPSARTAVRDLAGELALIRDYSNGAHWISQIIGVLHDEPYVAIEPATRSGIVGRMNGISDNFQLNVLLMDVFPRKGWFSRRRVSASAARIARGEGPQQSGELVTGFWNLYTWQALRRDASLPDPNAIADAWIWNEGTPADIPTFDGHRVILLGPPSYQRTWGAQRDFLSLKADLTIERELTPKEVSQWLGKLAAGRATAST